MCAGTAFDAAATSESPQDDPMTWEEWLKVPTAEEDLSDSDEDKEVKRMQNQAHQSKELKRMQNQAHQCLIP